MISSGILLINKPQGLTSNATLQRAKRLLGVKKAGHTGSLDPLATGMLPICFGEATKISQFLLDADKCYEVTAKLGEMTTTGDAEGELVQQRIGECTLAELMQALHDHSGEIQQIPPMYSALKHQGIPLYKLARQGKIIERDARSVTIQCINLSFFEYPYFSLKVVCTKGTYIRSLIESIGDQVKLGAHVTQLHRVYTAGFENEPMYTLEAFESLTLEERNQCVLPIESGIQQFSVIILSASQVTSIRYGQSIFIGLSNSSESSLVRIQDPNFQFIGMGELKPDGFLYPKRLLIP